MIPQGKISKYSASNKLLVPIRENHLIDYEWGGIAIQDTSQGMRYQVWQVFYNRLISSICIRRMAFSEEIVILPNMQNITRLGLAFDLNMRPTICYVQNGISYLYWYNLFTNEATITEFTDMKNPCITLDDSRSVQSSQSDIILAYQIGRDLYYRQQRDRYQIPLLLIENHRASTLFQIGMNLGNRLQFNFK